MLLSRIVRLLLIVADAFLALTAIAGGIGLLAGLNRPPVDLLQGSPFSDYTIPGLSLLVIVGGGALLTTVLLLRRHPYATLIAGASGIVIIGFEMIEILIIGSPAGFRVTCRSFTSPSAWALSPWLACSWPP